MPQSIYYAREGNIHMNQEYESYTDELAKLWIEGKIDFMTALELAQKKKDEIEKRGKKKVKTIYV